MTERDHALDGSGGLATATPAVPSSDAGGVDTATVAVLDVLGEPGQDAPSEVCSAHERGRTPPGDGQGVEHIVVLDFGGQYSQLIARRIRDCGVFSELLPHHTPVEEVARRRPRGIVLSGGPASVYADGAPHLQRGLLELGVPVLGICYGMQLIVHSLGGRVEQAEVGEFGRSDLSVLEPGRLLDGLPREQTCWMSHRDTVFEPPPGFTALASSSASPVAAVESGERRVYGDPVPPRGRAHAVRPGDPHALPHRRVRLRAHLVRGLDRRGADRAHPGPGRGRTRHLRTVRRRGLVGRGAARPPRGRRAAHVRFRRSRADAQGRGRSGDQRLPGQLQGPARRRGRRAALPGPARRASPSRRPSARRSGPSSSASSRRRRRRSRAPASRCASSSRARCTRT